MNAAAGRGREAPVQLERLAAGVRLGDLRVPGSSRDALKAVADSRGPGRVVLFSGPRSTGKALAAEAIANAIGVEAYRVDMTRVVSKYIGETEQRLDRVFGRAEAAGAVLLFDEADALFGKRSGVRDANDRYANQEIGHFLLRMEAFDGLAILATNRPGDIAPAVLKRRRATIGIPRLLS